MLKTEFLIKLRQKLQGLPPDDINEHINFYAEMINDRIEDGLTEEAAVSDIGTPEEIASEIICNTPLINIAAESISKKKKSLSALEIIMIILGSPIWLVLFVCAFAVVISLYAVLWSLVISAWAVFIALAAAGPLSICLCIIYFASANTTGGVFAIGAFALLAGLAIFTFFGAKEATLGTVKLTKRIIFSIKMRLAGKEKV